MQNLECNDPTLHLLLSYLELQCAHIHPGGFASLLGQPSREGLNSFEFKSSIYGSSDFHSVSDANRKIMCEGFGHYKWYQNLISNWECFKEDTKSPKRVDCSASHHLTSEGWRSIYGGLELNAINVFSYELSPIEKKSGRVGGTKCMWTYKYWIKSWVVTLSIRFRWLLIYVFFFAKNMRMNLGLTHITIAVYRFNTHYFDARPTWR